MSSSADAEDEPPRPARWVPTHVQVTVLRGRGLRGKGKNGTSDVYTIIQVGKEKYCTCVAERTTAPEWQEECSFELPPGALGDGSGGGRGGGGGGSDPAGGRDLVLTVMHRALIGLDVFLGQAVVPLDKAFQDNVYAKNGAEWVNLRSRWFRLNSKTGKKEKERGEVQATVQFTRNNLTASMYHLAMKDKSHSAFSKLKHNPFSGEVRSDPPPPLPYLSSSRPPIAHLFPQEPDPYPSLLRERPAPTDHAGTTSDAAGEGEALTKLKQRPLPPPPADEEERPLSKKSPNPFILSGTSGLDMQWDEAFEAFASCRLQSADDVATGSAQQPEPQKGPEQNPPKGPLLDKEDPPQTTDAVKDSDVNEASHPQNWGCLDTFTEPSSDGFMHLLAAIPATNHQASMLLTASLDSPDNNGGCADCLTSTTPPLALCHGCQCTHSPSFPCDIEKPKDCSNSPHPSSSGIGSLAEEDVLSSISSCSASEKLSASSGDDVETKSVNGCTLNPCEESPEQTVVGLLKDSENKLIDCSYPLIMDHKVEGNLIQVINQNEKPQSVILMDKDQWLVPLPVISLGPSPPHVPWSDLSSNHPNTSIPSDLEFEPTVSIQCDKTEKTERTCELRESFGDLQDPENNSVLAAKDNGETLPPDILDTEGTSICPSFHTVTSFFGEESSLLERPFGTGSLDQLVRQSSPKPSELIGLNNSQTMLTPIQVFNESTLMETPFGVSISDEPVVHRSSPKPSELLDLNTSQTLTTDVQVFDGTLSSEKWTPSPGSLLSSLYTSTDSQDYQTCLTHNSSTATTTSVDSLVEHPSENLWSSVLTLCGADSCGEISLVLPPENISALGLEGSIGVCGPSDMELDVNQEAGVELLTSKDICLPKELAPHLEPSFSVEDFGFHSDTPTDSDISYKTDNNVKLGGGTQENEGEPSAETSPAHSQTECPALQRSHSEGTLATGSSERPLTTYGSSPSVVQALHPNDPSGPPYSTRTPLLFLPPTSCLPAEPTAPLARRALPSATVTALLPSTPGPAPKALTPAPCIATPALDEAHATDAACAVLPPEVPQEKVEHQQNSPHPVRPLTPGPEERRVPEGRSVLASGLEKLRSTIHPGRSSQLSEAEPERRKSLTEGAGSYYHLTHNELVALLVRREAELERQKAEFERQTVLLSRREVELRKLKPQVRDLENYIDTLLVRIMEQTPTLLQVRSKFK